MVCILSCYDLSVAHFLCNLSVFRKEAWCWIRLTEHHLVLSIVILDNYSHFICNLLLCFFCRTSSVSWRLFESFSLLSLPFLENLSFLYYVLQWTAQTSLSVLQSWCLFSAFEFSYLKHGSWFSLSKNEKQPDRVCSGHSLKKLLF